MAIIPECRDRAERMPTDDVRLCGYEPDPLQIGKGRSHNGYCAIEMFRAPFAHVNRSARIAFMSITPGAEQMTAAMLAYRKARNAGEYSVIASASAKRAASLSADKRKTLDRYLEEVGLLDTLHLKSAAQPIAARSGPHTR